MTHLNPVTYKTQCVPTNSCWGIVFSGNQACKTHHYTVIAIQVFVIAHILVQCTQAN